MIVACARVAVRRRSVLGAAIGLAVLGMGLTALAQRAPKLVRRLRADCERRQGAGGRAGLVEQDEAHRTIRSKQDLESVGVGLEPGERHRFFLVDHLDPSRRRWSRPFVIERGGRVALSQSRQAADV